MQADTTWGFDPGTSADPGRVLPAGKILRVFLKAPTGRQQHKDTLFQHNGQQVDGWRIVMCLLHWKCRWAGVLCGSASSLSEGGERSLEVRPKCERQLSNARGTPSALFLCRVGTGASMHLLLQHAHVNPSNHAVQLDAIVCPMGLLWPCTP